MNPFSSQLFLSEKFILAADLRRETAFFSLYFLLEPLNHHVQGEDAKDSWSPEG